MPPLCVLVACYCVLEKARRGVAPPGVLKNELPEEPSSCDSPDSFMCEDYRSALVIVTGLADYRALLRM